MNKLIYLTKNSGDLNLVVDAAKLLLKNKKIPNDQVDGIGAQLMRLVYVLNDTNKGINLIKDKVSS